MAVQEISVSLRGYYADGRNVTASAFLTPLALSQSDKVAEVLCDRGQWQSALVVLSRRRVADYEHEPEPHESLAAAIRSDFEFAAQWLEAHGPGIQKIRNDGLETDLFLDLWIDEAQLELSYPPSLLQACGRLGLAIEMISND